MQPFDLELLLRPGLAIFFATLCVAFWVTRSAGFSIAAAFVKAGMFLLYFGLLFDGTFTFLDDWSYLEGGQALYAQGVGLTNLAENWQFLLMIGGGEQFAYYLYNTYAFQLFGEGYFAPVALNILLTLLVAWFGTLLAAREFGLSGTCRKWFFAFLLLHPDILAWSNIMNGKDIIVLLMHVLLLLSGSLFLGRRWVAALALAVPVALLLFFIRFYVPLLFSMVLVASLLLSQRRKGNLRLVFIAGGLMALLLAQLETAGLLQYGLGTLRETFINPVYGLMRFALTPIPFHSDVEYTFLNLPAIIHWLLIPFAGWGAVAIHRLHTPFSRFFLLYVLVFVSLYAVVGELQGPRQRVQLDYALAVLQFMGVMAFHRFFARRLHALIHSSAASPPPEGCT
jgi:hypothetical protein